jgi:hypothetical protein
MKERFFLAWANNETTVFVNLLQISQAVIGIENGIPICRLHLSNAETINVSGGGMLSILARISELSVALNGEPLPPVDERLGPPLDTDDKPSAT